VLGIVKKFGPLSENSSIPLVSQAGYGPDCRQEDISQNLVETSFKTVAVRI